MEVDVGKAGEGGLASGGEGEVVDNDEENVGPRVALHGAHVEEGEQGGGEGASGRGGRARKVRRVVEVVGDVGSEGKGLSADADEMVANVEELEERGIGNGKTKSVEEGAQFGE